MKKFITHREQRRRRWSERQGSMGRGELTGGATGRRPVTGKEAGDGAGSVEIGGRAPHVSVRVDRAQRRTCPVAAGGGF